MYKIIEGNKIIAKFMGATVTQSYSENKDYEQDGFLFYYPERSSPSIYRNMSSNSIKYHSSYDWIKPVVDKIGEIATFDTDGHDELYVKAGSVLSVQVCQSITVLWERIVEFIKWYNQNKQS